jgi:hypothetical protein
MLNLVVRRVTARLEKVKEKVKEIKYFTFYKRKARNKKS